MDGVARHVREPEIRDFCVRAVEHGEGRQLGKRAEIRRKAPPIVAWRDRQMPLKGRAHVFLVAEAHSCSPGHASQRAEVRDVHLTEFKVADRRDPPGELRD